MIPTDIYTLSLAAHESTIALLDEIRCTRQINMDELALVLRQNRDARVELLKEVG